MSTIRPLSYENIHAAFKDTCEAIAKLEEAKTRLADLAYKMKQVDNLQYLIDNVGRFAVPSDDAHEMLHFQREAAKQTLRDAEEGDVMAKIKADLQKAYTATERAWEKVR